MGVPAPQATAAKRTNVADGERALSVLAGAALALDGVRRRSASGVLELLLGAAALERGITGRCPLYSLLSVDTGPEHGAAADLPDLHPVRVSRSFIIRRTPRELYDAWRDLEHLPRFMRHLESVEVLEDGRSRWRARAPLGLSAEWEAEVVEDVPGERLAWRSLPGSEIANEGSVRFHALPGDRGTEVHARVEYAAPAGRAGVMVAKLFGKAPEQEIRKDLRHFKQLMEAGELPTTSGQPHGRR